MRRLWKMAGVLWLAAGLLAALALAASASDPSEPGAVFKDCPDCPEMVVIPPGQFLMGSQATDTEADADEHPLRQVKVLSVFAIGRGPVTFAEWDFCVRDGWCPAASDRGWGRSNRPVINVNWADVQQFLGWLHFKTGRAYRLPLEAEFEYAARAGTVSRYWWGNTIGVNNTVCQGCGSTWDGKMTAPVGSFKANPFGLFDMLGNVWQWTQECWQEPGKTTSATSKSFIPDSCELRVVRGGAWDRKPRSLRAANRARLVAIGRAGDVGFRAVRDLTP